MTSGWDRLIREGFVGSSGGSGGTGFMQGLLPAAGSLTMCGPGAQHLALRRDLASGGGRVRARVGGLLAHHRRAEPTETPGPHGASSTVSPGLGGRRGAVMARTPPPEGYLNMGQTVKASTVRPGQRPTAGTGAGTEVTVSLIERPVPRPGLHAGLDRGQRRKVVQAATAAGRRSRGTH